MYKILDTCQKIYLIIWKQRFILVYPKGFSIFCPQLWARVGRSDATLHKKTDFVLKLVIYVKNTWHCLAKRFIWSSENTDLFWFIQMVSAYFVNNFELEYIDRGDAKLHKKTDIVLERCHQPKGCSWSVIRSLKDLIRVGLQQLRHRFCQITYIFFIKWKRFILVHP